MGRRLRIVTAVFLVFSMLLSISGLAFAQASDIKGHWAEAQINAWMEKGLVKGYDDGTFRPNNEITRAEYCALLNRAFGFIKTAPSTFSDVAPSDWFAGDIAKAKAQGYLTGYQDQTARPRNPISRQEVAVILARVLKLKPDEDAASKFADAGSLAAWAKGSIGAVYKLGYINGDSNNNFKPDRNATRAEVVAILARAVGTLYNSGDAQGPATGTQEVKGNVTVTKAGATLKNLVVTGNLYLTEGIGDGTVNLENVTVKGTTIVSGGVNGITIIDSTLGNVVVNSPDTSRIRLIAKGSTKIGTVEVVSSAKLEEYSLVGTGGFTEVLAAVREGAKLELDGMIDQLKVVSPKAQVSLVNGIITEMVIDARDSLIAAESRVFIKTLTVNQPSKLEGLCTIETCNINANDVSIGPKPRTVNQAPNLTGVVIGASIVAGGGGGGGGGDGGGGGGSGGGGGGNTPVTVTGINPVDSIRVDFGTEIANIRLPSTVTVTLSDNTTPTLAVSWVTTTYNGNVPAIYTFPGTLTLPEGVTNPNNLTASISVTVDPQIENPKLAAVNPIADIPAVLGTGFSALGLPATVGVTLSDDSTRSLTVTWDQSTYNSNELGRQTIQGDLTLPAGIENPDNLKASVNVVVSPRAITVTAVAPETVIHVVYGTAAEAIGLPSVVGVTLSDGTTPTLSVIWDTDDYQQNVPGEYQIPGELSLPAGVTNPAGLHASARVIVGRDITVTGVEVLVDRSVLRGTSVANINLPQTVAVTLSGSGYSGATASVTWNTSNYNANAAGTYTFTGTLVNLPDEENPGDGLPDDVLNLNNIHPAIRVHVVQPVIDPNPNTPIRTSAGTTIDACDNLARWTAASRAAVSLDTNIRVHGNASINAAATEVAGNDPYNITENAFRVELHNNVNMNLSNMENVEFNFYTPDTSQIHHISVRLYSGSSHTSYFSRYSGNWRFVNGWNRMSILRSEFMENQSTGAPAPSWSNITCVEVLVFAQPGCKPSINIDRIAYNADGRAKILFTFDDAWYDLVDQSVTDNVYSVLSQRGFRATTWVNRISAESAGNSHTNLHMNTDDLDRLYDAGWDIGNHTVNHYDDLNIRSNEEVRNEFLNNQTWIESQGWTRGARFVAYPSGVYDERIVEILQGTGALAARTTVYGLQQVPVDNMYKLKCIYVDSPGGVADIARVRAEIDHAVETGSSVIFMLHRVENSGHPLSIRTSEFLQIVQYVEQLSRQNRLDVVTMSQWYDSYMGRSTVASVDAIPDINVEYGTAVNDIGLPSSVRVRLSDNTSRNVSVNWNTSSYNRNAAGAYTFTGTLTMPQNVTNPSNLRASIRVIVGQRPVVNVTGVNPLSVINAVYGADIEDVVLPTSVGITLSDGTTATAAITGWQHGAPDNSSADYVSYEFTGTLVLPTFNNRIVENRNNLLARVEVRIPLNPPQP